MATARQPDTSRQPVLPIEATRRIVAASTGKGDYPDRHAIAVAACADQLANRLQALLLLASRLEPDLKQSARDAADLLGAASQASTALEEFRRGPER